MNHPNLSEFLRSVQLKEKVEPVVVNLKIRKGMR